jgi:hypothetical protein
MSVLPFPLTVLAKLDRSRKGLFWVGTPKCSGGAYHVAWELACHSKENGGLDLKDLATLNKSLMMKHVHKLFTGESNPWTDWISFWYDEGRADDDTPCWRDIKKLILEYRQLTVVALGMGKPHPYGMILGRRLGSCGMPSRPCTQIASTPTSRWQ